MIDSEPPIELYETSPGELSPFAEVVAALASLDDDDEGSDATMDLEEIRLGLSIEFEVRDAASSSPRITGATPTQWTETTIMPVFHRLTMRITRESDG